MHGRRHGRLCRGQPEGPSTDRQVEATVNRMTRILARGMDRVERRGREDHVVGRAGARSGIAQAHGTTRDVVFGHLRLQAQPHLHIGVIPHVLAHPGQRLHQGQTQGA